MDARLFQAIWERRRDLRVGAPAACEFAAAFAQWVDERLNELGEQPSMMSLRQAQLIVTIRYTNWRNCVGEPHRSLMGSSMHTCIYDMWMDAWERLQVVELRMAPPPLWEPPPPPPPPAPSPRRQLAPPMDGIYFGELDGDG